MNSEPDWRSAVRVREDSALASELTERLARASPQPAVGVTDLVALRRAFWRRSGPPVPIPPEREARIEAGRRLHRQLERVVAPDGVLEVRVRRDGLVGRVDALTDRPIELKTSSRVVEPESLVADRPDQVEQLGMYCALLDRPVGRLVALATPSGSVEGVRTCDIAYRDLPAIRGEMVRRADRLRESLGLGRAAGLPRCRWFALGCEYRIEGTCDCTGNEPETSSFVLEQVEKIEPRPDVDADLEPRLRAVPRGAPGPVVRRFRDMIYPRRAYYDETRPIPPVHEAASPERAAGRESYRRLLEAFEGGPVGEVTRLPSLADEPEEEVGGFRGEPFLLRASRAKAPRSAEELLDRSPQYALELGFRCVATGHSSGRAIVGFESVAGRAGEVRVVEFAFSPISTFSRLWRERSHRWEEAVRARTPLALTPCPAWMFAACPYRAECACDSAGGRSQR